MCECVNGVSGMCVVCKCIGEYMYVLYMCGVCGILVCNRCCVLCFVNVCVRGM